MAYRVSVVNNAVIQTERNTAHTRSVVVSSNLERLLYYVCGADHTVAYMKALNETGEYQITDSELAEIRSIFTGVCASDSEGAAAIRSVFESEHYLMDTHTSIAWACMEKLQNGGYSSGRASVVLSTASPYKFSRAVLEALGEDPSESDEVNMNRVHEVTGAVIPDGLAGIFSREVRCKDVIEISDMKEYVIGKSR